MPVNDLGVKKVYVQAAVLTSMPAIRSGVTAVFGGSAGDIFAAFIQVPFSCKRLQIIQVPGQNSPQ